MPRPVVVQRTVGIIIAVVLAVLAFYAFGRTSDRPAPDARSTTTSAPSVTAPSADGATSTSTSTSTSPSTEAGAGALATSGPGLTEPGVHVVAQPDAFGGVEVVERVRVNTPIAGLMIALPHASGPGVAGTKPTMTGFQAQADGAVVTDMLTSPLPAGGDQLDFPSPATDITMRYRLEGGSDRSQPAPVGRVLIVLPPVTADLGLSGSPVVVEVVGGNIRNLVCPDLPVSDQLCGRQQGRVWTTTAVPLGRSVVVAQVDLPQPGER
ncbi:MAG: hypothetical protein ABJA74_05355 [Lapillicoccus sp.]